MFGRWAAGRNDMIRRPNLKRSARRLVSRRVLFVQLTLLCVVLPSSLTITAYLQQPETALDEFVPIDQLPPEDQIPAAPLLIIAYAFAWIALLGYFWSIRLRLNKIENELTEVTRLANERGRNR